MCIVFWYVYEVVDGTSTGDLAQLAARMLSMHKVAGSIPAFSIWTTQVLFSKSHYFSLISGLVNLTAVAYQSDYYAWYAKYRMAVHHRGHLLEDIRSIPCIMHI